MEHSEQNESQSFHEFSDDKKTSALKKYQKLVIGKDSIWFLLKYEFLIFLLTNVPGVLGLFLRQKLYKYILGKLSRGAVIGMGVSFRHPKKIFIDRSSIVDDFVSLSVVGSEKSGIWLAENVFVGRGSVLNVRDATIEVSKNTSIGSQCRIASTRGKIKIGEYVFIAAYCYLGGGNHKIDRTDIPIALQGFESKGGITIGDDVWIGANCVITDGVSVGKGSIIGACSYVNKDIPEYSIAFGSPATVHKKRK